MWAFPLAVVIVVVPPDIVTGLVPPRDVKVLVPFMTLNLYPVKEFVPLVIVAELPVK